MGTCSENCQLQRRKFVATAGTINPVLKSQYFLPAKEELTLQEGVVLFLL